MKIKLSEAIALIEKQTGKKVSLQEKILLKESEQIDPKEINLSKQHLKIKTKLMNTVNKLIQNVLLESKIILTEGKKKKAKELVKVFAKKHKIDFEELWEIVQEDYEDSDIGELTAQDIAEIADASGL